MGGGSRRRRAAVGLKTYDPGRQSRYYLDGVWMGFVVGLVGGGWMGAEIGFGSKGDGSDDSYIYLPIFDG